MSYENYKSYPPLYGSGNHMVDSDINEPDPRDYEEETGREFDDLSEVEQFIVKQLNCPIEDLDDEKKVRFYGNEITLCVTAAIRAVKEGRL